MTPVVKHRVLMIHDIQYHVFEWNNIYSWKTVNPKDLILNVLKENEALYYLIGSTRIFTNDIGFFHVQMELVNDIQLL